MINVNYYVTTDDDNKLKFVITLDGKVTDFKDITPEALGELIKTAISQDLV